MSKSNKLTHPSLMIFSQSIYCNMRFKYYIIQYSMNTLILLLIYKYVIFMDHGYVYILK